MNSKSSLATAIAQKLPSARRSVLIAALAVALAPPVTAQHTGSVFGSAMQRASHMKLEARAAPPPAARSSSESRFPWGSVITTALGIALMASQEEPFGSSPIALLGFGMALGGGINALASAGVPPASFGLLTCSAATLSNLPTLVNSAGNVTILFDGPEFVMTRGYGAGVGPAVRVWGTWSTDGRNLSYTLYRARETVTGGLYSPLFEQETVLVNPGPHTMPCELHGQVLTTGTEVWTVPSGVDFGF